MNHTASSDQIPAVLVGGPPHSGKSVLIYSLSQALRTRQVEHYALRACPDGEGDWSNQAPPGLVREIRIKGQWTPQWLQRIGRDIQRRHLPLLVDVGGRPTAEQAELFGLCTHAVLLTPDDASRAAWQELVGRQRLPVLADLRSTLAGENRLDATEPVLRGVLVDLERGKRASGPAFAALVERIAALFTADGVDYPRRHRANAPAEIELVVDLDRLARTLGWAQEGNEVNWLPEQLPALLEYLPAGAPLAIYGRGTAWIQAALALQASPAGYCSFDVRLGWVPAQLLPVGDPPADGPLRFVVSQRDDAICVEGQAAGGYIDWSQIDQVVAPAVSAGRGIVLSGKLPYWLFTSLARAYRGAPWLAVYQPALSGSVVVHSVDPRWPVGCVLPD
jgi:CRISPR-associated protein Csx3